MTTRRNIIKVRRISARQWHTLPYPPSVNRYWRTASNHVYTSLEARAYKEQVRWQLAHIAAPTSAAIALHIKAYRPRKAGDLDNIFKVAIDALQGVFFHDDKQIVEIHAARFDDKNNPRLEVAITPK